MAIRPAEGMVEDDTDEPKHDGQPDTRPIGGDDPGGDDLGGAIPRILVVDDEPAARTLVTKALVADGYAVVAAEDGLQALEALARSPFDMVLTDIVMPGIDGIELALKVAKDFPDTAILLMSGYPDERRRASGLEFLFQEVIEKPFALADLRRLVRTCLAENRAL